MMKMWPPRSAAARVAAPQGGADSAWGGPALNPWPPRSAASRVAAPQGGCFALGRPDGESLPPRSAASRVAAPQGGCFALGRPDGETLPPRSAAARVAARSQRGAALLLAMVTVTLVATIATAAMWQQWRATEIETAERQRVQAGWILNGALDWARLILREDARSNQNSGNADHLGEPWATPLEEARLASFLAADKNNNSASDDVQQAFLSGEVIDLQSRLNFLNLVRVIGSGATSKAEVSEQDQLIFTRLYEQLDLPQAELKAAIDELKTTRQLALTDPLPSRTPLVPQKLAQLAWLGIGPASLAAMEPYVTVLPERSKLNLNTASAIAIAAGVTGVDMSLASQMVTERERNPFRSLSDVGKAFPVLKDQVNDQQHDVRSRFFEIRGRLRLDDAVIEERSLVARNNLDVNILWRERGALP